MAYHQHGTFYNLMEIAWEHDDEAVAVEYTPVFGQTQIWGGTKLIMLINTSREMLYPGVNIES
jgi:hypothetical protein